jgi:hypothetical protein
MVSIAQAWGPDAASATFTSQVDASHYLPFISLAPDGRSLYGYEVTLVNGALTAALPAQAGVLDMATRQFTPIGVASAPKCVGNSCQFGPPTYYIECCQTDGRFLIATSTGFPGPDCGGCLWSYDQRTGAVYEVAAGNQYQGLMTDLVDHGVLVVSTGTGILIADLAARTLTRIPGTTSGTRLDAFSWPYILLGSPGGAQQTTTVSIPLEVYDLAKHTTTPLPQVTGNLLSLVGATLYYVAMPDVPATGSSSTGATLNELDHLTEPGAQPRMLATLPSGPGTSALQALAISDDTLFFAIASGFPTKNGCLPGFGVVCPTAVPAPPPITTLYELDEHLSSAPHVRAIAAYAANLESVVAANARLVVLHGAAWDRAEGRFVALESPDALSGHTPGLREDAAGTVLMLGQPLSQGYLVPWQITIYDAAHLPVLAA